jgi:hypothetical protein
MVMCCRLSSDNVDPTLALAEDVITLSLTTGQIVDSVSASFAGKETQPCFKWGFDPRQWRCGYVGTTSDALGPLSFTVSVRTGQQTVTRNTTTDGSFVNRVSVIPPLNRLILDIVHVDLLGIQDCSSVQKIVHYPPPLCV